MMISPRTYARRDRDPETREGGTVGAKRKTFGNTQMSIAQQAQRILERAKARGLTIVTAESCTAGAVATSLSKASGAGEHFQGGFVTYTKEMKSSVLGVPLKLLQQKGAVCEEVAEAMALGALKLARPTLLLL